LWLELEWDKPSRADYYVNRAASAAAGKNLDMLKFSFAAPAKAEPKPEGFEGYWPKPLTKEEVERAKETINKADVRRKVL